MCTSVISSATVSRKCTYALNNLSVLVATQLITPASAKNGKEDRRGSPTAPEQVITHSCGFS